MASVKNGSHSSHLLPTYIYPEVEWAILAFTLQPQSITTLWLILISHPAEGRRMGWPGWLGKIPRWFACPKMITYPNTNRDGRESNCWPLSCKSSTLATRLQSLLFVCSFKLIWWNVAKYTAGYANVSLEQWWLLLCISRCLTHDADKNTVSPACCWKVTLSASYPHTCCYI